MRTLHIPRILISSCNAWRQGWMFAGRGVVGQFQNPQLNNSQTVRFQPSPVHCPFLQSSAYLLKIILLTGIYLQEFIVLCAIPLQHAQSLVQQPFDKINISKNDFLYYSDMKLVYFVLSFFLWDIHFGLRSFVHSIYSFYS